MAPPAEFVSSPSPGQVDNGALCIGQRPRRRRPHDPAPKWGRGALDVDRVGEATAAALGWLEQMTVAHAGPGHALLVGEEAAFLELDDTEAQAQAGAKHD